jgi:hypothetical protein
MKPYKIDFSSYTYSGEMYEHCDTNSGECSILFTDDIGKMYEPVSFFRDEMASNFYVKIMEPLIRRFSASEQGQLKFIDLSEHDIWMPRRDEKLVGKVTGCRVKNGFPYDFYAFGFTPFSFYFDPFLKGDPIEASDNPDVLRILKDAEQEILNTYNSIVNYGRNGNSKEFTMSDFLWEESTRKCEGWNFWQCYFFTRK